MMLSSKPARDRRRKPTKILEAASSRDNRNPNEGRNKIRRVSTSSSASTATSLQVDALVATEKVTAANTTSAAAEHEESIQIMGIIIQYLFRSDNAKVDISLAVLGPILNEVKKKRESFATAGGCLALLLLLEKCLDTAIARIPDCHQVTELNEHPELRILRKTLMVIIILTCWRYESRAVGITAIGGVEVVVKIMKTFP